jgi:hypothetical protein
LGLWLQPPSRVDGELREPWEIGASLGWERITGIAAVNYHSPNGERRVSSGEGCPRFIFPSKSTAVAGAFRRSSAERGGGFLRVHRLASRDTFRDMMTRIVIKRSFRSRKFPFSPSGESNGTQFFTRKSDRASLCVIGPSL